jgi:hypothetical protein
MELLNSPVRATVIPIYAGFKVEIRGSVYSRIENTYFLTKYLAVIHPGKTMVSLDIIQKRRLKRLKTRQISIQFVLLRILLGSIIISENFGIHFTIIRKSKETIVPE